jgi:SAM-dependent methyltransferase
LIAAAEAGLPPAARAFDTVAERFDERFAPWLSVAAQRRAVRRCLAHAFPGPARLLEIGGGTGDDALWMAARGHDVLMTDVSPAMIAVAARKFAGQSHLQALCCGAEALPAFAESSPGQFDGVWSTFAALNCVVDLAPVAAGLARVVRPGGQLLLVLFGTCCPGEMIVEGARGRPRNMFRRFRCGAVPARLGGEHFTVRYHRAADIERSFAPWFVPRGRRGMGVFVPPSAAEPWISRHPRLLTALEAIDERLAGPLAIFGDHVLYRLERRAVPAP